MSILSDVEILGLCKHAKMIDPYEGGQVRWHQNDKIISYGVSSYGYDIRIGNKFKIFHNARCAEVDPKNFDTDAFFDVKTDGSVLIPPNSFMLAQSYEYIRVPRDILVICIGKSTYARCGLPINVTPLEPEWHGHITIEIGNQTPLPARIYANEGIAQLVFHRAKNVCKTSYADRKGKYQGQTGVTLPKA